MNVNRAPLLLLALLAVVICAGCDKPQPPPPAPVAPPVVTNTPPPASATNAPKIEAPAAPKPAVGNFITPEDAKNHVGEFATVRGKVFGVRESQKGDVFMDIGDTGRNAPFTAVCFKKAIPTETLKAFYGKTVSIKGKIKDYNGKAEIILDSAEQISE